DVISSDSSTVVTTRVVSSATALVNTWTYIAGVYNVSTNSIALYVNGALQGTQTLAAQLWNAQGVFVVGRDRYTGISAGWWTGGIDRVRVWGRALTAAEIGAEAVHLDEEWTLNFDGAADLDPAHDLADITDGGVTFSDGNNGQQAAQFDG